MTTQPQTLQVVREKLDELNKAIKALEVPKPKVIKMPMAVLGVFKGDVWYYPPNKKFGIVYYTVKSVNKKQDRVEFTDDGWNRYSDMIEGKWVLVARQFNKAIRQKVEKLSCT